MCVGIRELNPCQYEDENRCSHVSLAYIELFMTIPYVVRRSDMVVHDTTFEDIRIVSDYGLRLSKSMVSLGCLKGDEYVLGLLVTTTELACYSSTYQMSEKR